MQAGRGAACDEKEQGEGIAGGDARVLPRHSPLLDRCQSLQEQLGTSSQAEDELTGCREMSPSPPLGAWSSYLYREHGGPTGTLVLICPLKCPSIPDSKWEEELGSWLPLSGLFGSYSSGQTHCTMNNSCFRPNNVCSSIYNFKQSRGIT